MISEITMIEGILLVLCIRFFYSKIFDMLRKTKSIIYVLCIPIVLLSCKVKEESLSGQSIIEQSITKHDPNASWDTIDLKIHIQEPRLSNPGRYSIVSINNATNAFKLIRNRDTHLAEYSIDDKGNAQVALDGIKDIDEELIEKYRLNPKRNKGYQDFYRIMYGLPMSLTSETIESIDKVSIETFNKIDCFKIEIKLKEKLFSKHWYVFISKMDYELKGIEIIFPDDTTKGERLYFDGNIEIKNINIPRIRHWHEYSDNAYLGSDIIVKTIMD